MENRVKAVRLFLGKSASQMASLLKVNEYDVLAWENGRAIPLRYAEKIAKLAEIDVRFILGDAYDTRRNYNDLYPDEKEDIDNLKSEASEVVSFFHLGGYFTD